MADASGWRKHLDAEAIAFLEAYRLAKSAYVPPPAQIEDLLTWLKCIADTAIRFPHDSEAQQSKTVAVEKDVLQVLRQNPLFAGLKDGENTVPPGLAVILEVVQSCTALFERSGSETRMAAYLMLGIAYRMARPFWDHLRFERFGTEPLDQEKVVQLAATVLETVAKLLRNQWRPPKGRVDAELIGVVNFIQRHAYVPLPPADIRAALIQAGFSVADGETFRIWLHRVRKRGLVAEQQRPPREIIVDLNPDGSFDLSSVDGSTRLRLLRALRDFERQE